VIAGRAAIRKRVALEHGGLAPRRLLVSKKQANACFGSLGEETVLPTLVHRPQREEEFYCFLARERPAHERVAHTVFLPA
jgi:hypothetical protein